MKKRFFILCLLLITSISIASPKPYVILVSFDGFRWDYLNRGIAPNLEKIKKKVFRLFHCVHHFLQKLFPNHLSIITGICPAHHGIIANSFADPFNKSYYRMSDTIAVRDAKWYLGEAFWETAKRQGIITASYFYLDPKFYFLIENQLTFNLMITNVLMKNVLTE